MIGVPLGTRGGLPGRLTRDFTSDSNPALLPLGITPSGAKLCAFPGFGGVAASICSPVAGSPARMTVAGTDKDGRLDVVMLRTFDSQVVTNGQLEENGKTVPWPGNCRCEAPSWNAR